LSLFRNRCTQRTGVPVKSNFFLKAIKLICDHINLKWFADNHLSYFVMIFIGTIFTAHIGNGFFMNWYGIQKGEGFEYAFLVIGLSIATLINGSGKYSIDNIVFKG